MDIQCYWGRESERFIDPLADFRIRYFREYPYLYDGTPAYEAEYLKGYFNNPEAYLITITEGETLLGLSTAIPLLGGYGITEGAEALFSAAGLKAEDYYYFGEILLAPEVRGLGLARRIYAMQERIAHEKGYRGTCFLTVLRPEGHPLRPEGYRDTEILWPHLGYQRLQGTTDFSWPTLQPDGSTLEMDNPMAFWVKML